MENNYTQDEISQKVCLKYKINTNIFTTDKIDSIGNRISYMNVNTMMRYKIFNRSWNVINHKDNKTLTYIISFDNCEEEIIYIHPSLAYILKIDSYSNEDMITISDIYDEILSSRINRLKNTTSLIDKDYNYTACKS